MEVGTVEGVSVTAFLCPSCGNRRVVVCTPRAQVWHTCPSAPRGVKAVLLQRVEEENHER